MHKVTNIVLVGLFLFGATLGGCATTSSAAGNRGIQPPEWYKNRSKVKDICGFGNVEYNGDYGLAESSAIANARDELARNFKTKVKGFQENVRAAGRSTVDGEKKSAARSAQENYTRQLIDSDLKFTTVRATEMSGDVFFAGVCVEVNKYLDEMKNMGAASEQFNEFSQQLSDASNKLDGFLESDSE